jgi:hypothetical protein
MGTLKGFPTSPALWLRRAKPSSANADALIRREEPVSEPCRLSAEVLSKLPAASVRRLGATAHVERCSDVTHFPFEGFHPLKEFVDPGTTRHRKILCS